MEFFFPNKGKSSTTVAPSATNTRRHGVRFTAPPLASPPNNNWANRASAAVENTSAMLNTARLMGETNVKLKVYRKDILERYNHAIANARAIRNTEREANLRMRANEFSRQTERWKGRKSRKTMRHRRTRKNSRK